MATYVLLTKVSSAGIKTIQSNPRRIKEARGPRELESIHNRYRTANARACLPRLRRTNVRQAVARFDDKR